MASSVQPSIETHEEAVRSAHPAGQFLRHAMIVGGTLSDWDRLGDRRWAQRVADLGVVASNAGASFLTLRAFEPGPEPSAGERWERIVEGCHVVVDPCGDGRARFAEAMAALPDDEPINEASISEMLYAPADCEPDLVLVLGEPTRLPPSLVWELAYGELVFIPLEWDELGPDHLVEAIADFARRERRFGGIDEDDASEA